ncbi:MAG: hypothetical protein Q4C67_11585, partial [Deinococcus sp.]|nr:hypothetical protein [Deinococcus sp.]
QYSKSAQYPETEQAAPRPSWAEPTGPETPATADLHPAPVEDVQIRTVHVQDEPLTQTGHQTEAQMVVAATPAVTVSEGEPVISEESRPLGRVADGVAVAPAEGEQRAAPQVSPQERLRRRHWMGLGSRMIGGLVTLGALLAALGSGWSWSSVLFVWVLLTILADEFGGWFGYIAAFMGLLTLVLGNQPAEVWQMVLPLVGGALLALLVVKHSGGWGVLPFAGAVFALPLIGAAQFGHLLDKNLLLVADPDLGRSAILAMLVGLGISLVRQFILWLVDLTGRRHERRLLRADQVPLR